VEEIPSVPQCDLPILRPVRAQASPADNTRRRTAQPDASPPHRWRCAPEKHGIRALRILASTGHRWLVLAVVPSAKTVAVAGQSLIRASQDVLEDIDVVQIFEIDAAGPGGVRPELGQLRFV